jgi:hypothetical protein
LTIGDISRPRLAQHARNHWTSLPCGIKTAWRPLRAVTRSPGERTLATAAEHGALAMKTPDSTALASLREVVNLMKGARARV